MSANRAGKIVSIRYKGGVKGEDPVDDHSTGEPLTVMLGDMRLPLGIEEAIADMVKGEKRTVEVPCEKGYGTYQEQLAQWYPRQLLDNGYELKKGDVLFWTNPEDQRKMPAWVTDETDDNVRIDFNHPFAGMTLEYWIELVDVR